MEKKTAIVFICPFCKASIWFNKTHELSQHLQKEHLRETLNTFCLMQKQTVKTSGLKWSV